LNYSDVAQACNYKLVNKKIRELICSTGNRGCPAHVDQSWIGELQYNGKSNEQVNYCAVTSIIQ